VESKQERQLAFRVPKNELPKGTHDEVTMGQINSAFCQVFPEGLDCPKS
jgi:hypothetical protein